MESGIFNLNNKIYYSYNNILLEIINDLYQLQKYIHDNLIIQRLGNIITKMNYIINENKKNVELIRNDISTLYNKLNKRFDELNINNNIKEIKYDNGRYVGQFVNGLKEGKGIYYYNSGSRYEGDYKNDKREGKGIYYYNNGNRYEGDWINGSKEGKGIFYFNNGDRYEGDWRNDNREGKGIYYYNNGDRRMGDYSNGNPIGKHVTLTRNGEVNINNY